MRTASPPAAWEWDALLADGSPVHVRPIKPGTDDAEVAFVVADASGRVSATKRSMPRVRATAARSSSRRLPTPRPW